MFRGIRLLFINMFMNNIRNTQPMYIHKEHNENKNMNIVKKFLSDDTKENIMYVFLAVAIIITLILLSIAGWGIICDILTHKMITTDMSGVASYIVAVAGIFSAAGACTAWSQWSYHKYNNNNNDPYMNISDNNQDMPQNMPQDIQEQK